MVLRVKLAFIIQDNKRKHFHNLFDPSCSYVQVTDSSEWCKVLTTICTRRKHVLQKSNDDLKYPSPSRGDDILIPNLKINPRYFKIPLPWTSLLRQPPSKIISHVISHAEKLCAE